MRDGGSGRLMFTCENLFRDGGSGWFPSFTSYGEGMRGGDWHGLC